MVAAPRRCLYYGCTHARPPVCCAEPEKLRSRSAVVFCGLCVVVGKHTCVCGRSRRRPGLLRKQGTRQSSGLQEPMNPQTKTSNPEPQTLLVCDRLHTHVYAEAGDPWSRFRSQCLFAWLHTSACCREARSVPGATCILYSGTQRVEFGSRQKKYLCCAMRCGFWRLNHQTLGYQP